MQFNHVVVVATQVAKFSCPDEVSLISLVCTPGWRKLHNEVFEIRTVHQILGRSSVGG